jgi:hypothetical protein
MAKKSGTSSRPERLITVNSKDIFNKPLTKRQQAVADRALASQLAGEPVHYCDIPPLTDQQLAAQPAFWAARAAQGRPPAARQDIRECAARPGRTRLAEGQGQRRGPPDAHQ